MKKILFIIIIFLSGSYIAFSQDVIQMDEISQERIFVHHNTTFLITGEYLYYKVYCINNETNNLSAYSKIAYVELINSEKNTIFKHKIILKNGMGDGDFFIPTSLNSGNYKLISYTQWMRNTDISNFYQNDISIVNPFQENQKAILYELPTSKSDNNSTSINNNLKRELNINSDLIRIHLNAESFNEREKVSLKIHALQDNSLGNFSLSVRKIDSLKTSVRNTASTYTQFYNSKKNYTPVSDRSVSFLPELRGELLSGKVLLKETGLAAGNIKVALSIPGENYIFKIANTNKNGVYFFNIGKEYTNENANIQILDEAKNKYKLVINSQLPLDYKKVKFYNFKITPSEKDLILNHSIANQIENAYAGKKSDSINNIENIPPFFNDKDKIYLLDDYTRFKTIKETFIEITPEIYSRQRNGKLTFHVRIFGKEIESGLSPLVLIDGFLIQDQTELLDFDSNKIKEIHVVSDMYMYGSKLFEGIISLNTFKGNYKSSVSSDAIQNIKLAKPLASKNYFNQTYNNKTNTSRIPDFRRQLLWKPSFIVNKTDTTIDFYTSDNTGAFEICMEGFTIKGKPVSIRKIIYVENKNK